MSARGGRQDVAQAVETPFLDHKMESAAVPNSKAARIGRVVSLAVRAVPVVVALVVLVATIAWMEGFFESKIAPGVEGGQGRPVGEVKTAVVSVMETSQTADAVGTVQPRRKSVVASRLLAAVLEVAVDPGQSVKVGDLLVTLDDREIQAQLREVEAVRAGVESDLAVRQREWERAKRMLAEKAASREDYDRAEGVYLVSQSQLKRTDEQIARIKVMLSYTRILAPRDGIVADRFADPGDLAAPGKPLLSLHDPEALELHASLREGLASRVSPGQTLRVHVDSIQMTVDGTVREITPQVEAASRSVLVKVSLPVEAASRLYVGMFGRLEIPVGQTRRIVVPSEAVHRVGQLEVVDVVREGNLSRRFVRTGQQLGEMVEILAGLKIGETVAVAQEELP